GCLTWESQAGTVHPVNDAFMWMSAEISTALGPGVEVNENRQPTVSVASSEDGLYPLLFEPGQRGPRFGTAKPARLFDPSALFIEVATPSRMSVREVSEAAFNWEREIDVEVGQRVLQYVDASSIDVFCYPSALLLFWFRRSGVAMQQ
ncbi:hypothetical protein FOZ63_012489, partial [Perkinsus olseni]